MKSAFAEGNSFAIFLSACGTLEVSTGSCILTVRCWNANGGLESPDDRDETASGSFEELNSVE